MGKNSVSLEGTLKRKGVRRGFFGELTTLFLEVPTSRGRMHVLVLARLPEEARGRLADGMTVQVEGELDYERKRNGGFEVFVSAKRVRVLAGDTPPGKEDGACAEFDF